jgi:hypothetical protein
MGSLGFFIDVMLRADNLPIFMGLPRNLGASTSWNPKGLSRPVMGLLYLYLIYIPGLFPGGKAAGAWS